MACLTESRALPLCCDHVVGEIPGAERDGQHPGILEENRIVTVEGQREVSSGHYKAKEVVSALKLEDCIG